MGIEDIKFPASTISKEGYLQMVHNPEDLLICTNTAFKNGQYNGLLIVDSGGKRYQILNAKKERPFGGFFGFNIFLARKFWVSLNFSPEAKILNLEEYKLQLIDSINNHADFWDAGGNLEEIISIVKAGTSFQEINHRLTELVYST